ncbi:MAG: DHH family phosphoesterase [Candidatus Nanoarchaeia archaeon]
MNFNAGNTFIFKEFIDNIKNTDKISLISHTDLDGIASAKVVNKSLNIANTYFINYDQLNQELLQNIKKDKTNKLIITDISISNQELFVEIEKNFETLIIDHHRFPRDYNNHKIKYINSQENCAAYIAYDLFSKFNDITGLDWIVALACLSDWMYKNNSLWLEKTFDKYNQRLDIQNLLETPLWDYTLKIADALVYFKDTNPKKAYELISEKPFELERLLKYSKFIKKELEDNFQLFEKERIEIPAGYFYEIKAKHDIASRFSTEVSSKDPSKLYICSFKKNNLYKISLRKQDKKMDTSLLAKDLTASLTYKDAGGHIPASGATIAKTDYEIFLQRIKKINPEKYLVTN